MLRRANHSALDLGPVYARVQWIIDQADQADILATDNVESQGNLDRRLAFFGVADDALYCVLENLVGSQHAPKSAGGGIWRV